MIVAGEVREQQVCQYLHESELLLRVDKDIPYRLQYLGQPANLVTEESDVGTDDDEEEDEEEGESDMAATLLQLMRDNARLEALNASHIKKIKAARDSCAHLKVYFIFTPF